MAQAQPDRKLMKRLLHQVGSAIQEFGLIEDGDRILVGVSGGKDSFTLLYLLQRLRERAPIRFDLVACNLDQGHPGFPGRQLEEYLRSQACEVRMLREDTYSVVKRLTPEGGTTCAVCSRLRRGILYSAAAAMGNVLPGHLLDARLYPREGQTGADPWIDGDDCADPAPLLATARF